jgi:hypothetical protein
VEGIPLGNKAAFTQIRQRLNGLAPGNSFKVSILRRGQLLDLTGRTP